MRCSRTSCTEEATHAVNLSLGGAVRGVCEPHLRLCLVSFPSAREVPLEEALAADAAKELSRMHAVETPRPSWVPRHSLVGDADEDD